MIPRDFVKYAGAAVVGALLVAGLGSVDGWAQDKKWKIGFSQATTIEPWRAQ